MSWAENKASGVFLFSFVSALLMSRTHPEAARRVLLRATRLLDGPADGIKPVVAYFVPPVFADISDRLGRWDEARAFLQSVVNGHAQWLLPRTAENPSWRKRLAFIQARLELLASKPAGTEPRR